MDWMSWSRVQRTGNSEMDHGHENLVDLINQLADGMQQGKTKEYCSNILEQFLEHLRIHFAAEERLMESYRYPKAAEHIALHETLLKDVNSFKASYDASGDPEFTTLLVILDNWLTRDITAADKALADFVAASA